MVRWVNSSTQRVPDGHTVPANHIWAGSLGNGDVVTVQIASNQVDPPQLQAGFDIAIHDQSSGNLLYTNGMNWGTTNKVWVQSVTAQPAVFVDLLGGGSPTQPNSGYAFGVTLDIDELSTTFGDPDRQLLVDIERKLDVGLYTPTVVHNNIGSNLEITVQPGTRAIGWAIVARPPGSPVTTGLPPYYYHLGFVTPYVGVGYMPSVRIKFTPQVMQLPNNTTRVAFTVSPGCVLNVTEYTIPIAVA